MFRRRKTQGWLICLFVVERTSCHFDVKKGPVGKAILYPNISYDLGMIRDHKGWVAPHLFAFLQAQVGWVPTRNSHFLRYIDTILETNSEENPWTSMFGRWFISFWGNFGLFSEFQGVCLPVARYSWKWHRTCHFFFEKPSSADFFSVGSNTCIGSTSPTQYSSGKWRFTWIC